MRPVDAPGGVEAPDTLGMRAATLGLAQQVADAAAAGSGVDLPTTAGRDVTAADIDNVVVLGMGGSGLAGDVLVSVAGPFMAVPVVVHKAYGIPNFIGPRTLVFAVSFSGNTEETVEATTLAAEAGAHLVAVTRGGELAGLAGDLGAPVVPIADGIPMPRAALGAVSIPPLVIAERLGLFPGAQAWIDAAVTQLQRRQGQLEAGPNDATELARRIGRTFPLVYGAGGIGRVAATRFKNQCNENAKVPAFANTHPELCHNELAGWGQAGDVTRQVFHLVHLRHDFEHPQVGRRVELVTEIMAEVMGGASEVTAAGDGPLAQLLDLALIGDVASLELAAAEGVDPGPIPVLDDLKTALSIETPGPNGP